MHHLSHLCRPGRPIITPACKYWSTAPVCMCYFKMPRPVISMLMIVIAKATGSAWLFKACGYQWEAGRPSTQIQTCTREVGSGAGWCSNEGALGLVGSNLQAGSLPAVCLSPSELANVFVISPGLRYVCVRGGWGKVTSYAPWSALRLHVAWSNVSGMFVCCVCAHVLLPISKREVRLCSCRHSGQMTSAFAPQNLGNFTFLST